MKYQISFHKILLSIIFHCCWWSPAHCDIEVLYEDKTSFTQLGSLTFNVPISNLNRQLFFEVTIIQQTTPFTSQLEFIFFAAEPSVNLPDFYSILFQYQKLEKYLGSRIHFDQEGFSALRTLQLVRIEQLFSSQIGDWTIGLYDLKSDKSQEYDVYIKVFSLPTNEKYFPENCNNQLSPLNNYNNSLSLMNKMCNCAKGYLGYSCYLQGQSADCNSQLQVQIDPLQWKIQLIDLSNLGSSKLQLLLAGIIQKIKLCIIYGATGDLFVPNILGDNYDITQTNSAWQEYPLVQERIDQMFQKQTILTADKNHPERDTFYDYYMIIGFFNENPTTPANLFFQLKSTGSSGDGFFNKTALILFISFGSAIIFCITPIAYFCLKQHTKRREELLQSMVIQTNNQNNNPNASSNNQNNNSNNFYYHQDQLTSQVQSAHQQQQQIQQQQIQANFVSNNSPPLSEQQIQQLEDLNNSHFQHINNVNQDNIPSATSRNGLQPQSSRRRIIRRQGDQPDFEGQNPSANRAGGGVEDFIVMNQNGSPILNKPIRKIVPITKDTINKFMPKQPYQDILRLYPTLKEEGEECTVCLESFDQDSLCRITPCFHLFHSECLESWFKKHSTCPYCRASCNRKGIIQQLQHGQTNSYVKRIQQALAETKRSGVLGQEIRSEECFSDPNDIKVPIPITESILKKRAEAQRTLHSSNRLPSQPNNLNQSHNTSHIQRSEKQPSQKFISIAENIINHIKNPSLLFKKDTSIMNSKMDEKTQICIDQMKPDLKCSDSMRLADYAVSNHNNIANRTNHKDYDNQVPIEEEKMNDYMMSINYSINKESGGLSCRSPLSNDQSYNILSTSRKMLQGQQNAPFLDEQPLSPVSYDFSGQAHPNKSILSGFQSDMIEDQSLSPNGLIRPNMKGFRSAKNKMGDQREGKKITMNTGEENDGDLQGTDIIADNDNRDQEKFLKPELPSNFLHLDFAEIQKRRRMEDTQKDYTTENNTMTDRDRKISKNHKVPINLRGDLDGNIFSEEEKSDEPIQVNQNLCSQISSKRQKKSKHNKHHEQQQQSLELKESHEIKDQFGVVQVINELIVLDESNNSNTHNSNHVHNN